MEQQLQTIDQIKGSILDMTIRFGPKFFVALLIVAAGWLVARWSGNVLQRLLERFSLEIPVRALLVRICRILVITLFLILALQNLGVELLPLIAGLGIVGAGTALAMQGMLANIVAGLTIIFTQPYRVGHYISIADEEGEVLDISLFNTILGHPDQSRIVVPNRKIVGEILHNFGAIRQIHLEVNVPYGTDVDQALTAIQDTVQANARVMNEPPARIGVARLAESGITLGIHPWVHVPDYIPASAELNQTILAALAARNIPIALPQREIRLRQDTEHRTTDVR